VLEAAPDPVLEVCGVPGGVGRGVGFMRIRVGFGECKSGVGWGAGGISESGWGSTKTGAGRDDRGGGTCSLRGKMSRMIRPIGIRRPGRLACSEVVPGMCDDGVGRERGR
jgi:hypothetical protein